MQQTLSENGFEKFCKKTRKERFLEEMETIYCQSEQSSDPPTRPHPRTHRQHQEPCHAPPTCYTVADT